MTSNLATEKWGEGHSEVAVLVHGSFSTDPASTWLKQHELSEHYCLVMPSRSGYDNSHMYGTHDTLEEDVQGVIELLGGGSRVVGVSYG